MRKRQKLEACWVPFVSVISAWGRIFCAGTQGSSPLPPKLKKKKNSIWTDTAGFSPWLLQTQKATTRLSLLLCWKPCWRFPTPGFLLTLFPLLTVPFPPFSGPTPTQIPESSSDASSSMKPGLVIKNPVFRVKPSFKRGLCCSLAECFGISHLSHKFLQT